MTTHVYVTVRIGELAEIGGEASVLKSFTPGKAYPLVAVQVLRTEVPLTPPFGYGFFYTDNTIVVIPNDNGALVTMNGVFVRTVQAEA